MSKNKYYKAITVVKLATKRMLKKKKNYSLIEKGGIYMMELTELYSTQMIRLKHSMQRQILEIEV